MAGINLTLNPSSIVQNAAVAKSALDEIKEAAVKTEVELRALGSKGGAAVVAVGAKTKTSSTQAVQALNVLEDEYRQVTTAAAVMADTVERRAVTTAVAVNRGTGFMATGARQLGMQLSQVGQQTMASGNFIQALAIQLPDIGLAFGTVGIAAGLLAGIALPLLGKAFGGGAAAATKMADANSRLGDSISALSAIGDTSLEGLRKRYGEVDAELLKLLGHQRDLQLTQAQDAARSAVKALANEYGIASGVMNLFRITGKGAAADVAKDLGFSKDAMLGFQAAIREANAATTFEDQAAALAKIDGYLQRSTINGSAMATEVNSAALALREVEAAAAAALANQTAMPGALGVATSAAGGLAQGLMNAGSWALAAKREMDRVAAATKDAASAAVIFAGTNLVGPVAAAASSAQALATNMNISLRAAQGMLQLGFESKKPVIFDPRDPNFNQTAATAARLRAAAGTVSPFSFISTASSGVSGGGGGGGGGGANAAEAASKAYDSLAASIDPVIQATQEYTAAQLTINEALKAGHIGAAEAAATLDKVTDRFHAATEAAKAGATVWDAFQQAGGNAFDRLISGAGDLKSALQDVVKEIGLAIIKKQLLANVKGGEAGDSVGSLLFKGLFGGFFDSGGTIGMGRTGIVGERGPEIVRSTPSGTVVTSRVDTARQRNQPQQVVVSSHITVGIDDEGKLQAYVQRSQVAAALQGAVDGTRNVRRNFHAWSQELRSTNGPLAV